GIPSNNPENLAEDGLLPDDAIEGGHERLEPIVAHRGDAVVPVEPLAVERVRAALDGVDLEVSVEARLLAGGAEQRQERVGDGGEQQQAISPARVADVRGRQAHPEVEVLLVAERLLD